jgi:hypothetical protein
VSLPITVYVKDSTLVPSRARIWPQQHAPKRLKTYATRNGRRLKTRLFGHLQRSRRALTDEQEGHPLSDARNTWLVLFHFQNKWVALFSGSSG